METELKPTRRRRAAVDPDERRAELEEQGIYTTPLRVPEPFEGITPEQIIEEAEVDLVAAARRIFGDEAPAKRGLHAKLSEMLEEIGAVQKTGTAPKAMGGFKFTEASHLAERIRASLSSKKISMLPERQEIAESTQFTSKSGSTQFLVTIKTTWRVTDAESGETATFESFGSGQDGSDKALPKAQTNALKYAMLLGWLVPQSDDPELFANEEPEAPGMAGAIHIESSAVPGVHQGGRQTIVTSAQINAIRSRARELNMEPLDLCHILEQVTGNNLAHGWPDETTGQIEYLLRVIGDLTFEQASNVIALLTAAE